ncbi:MAG TPA: DNA mismatch repair protein MutS, partial [Clostridia bacterium]|nr:DNA mismatch repair protein MutS [Clostridia bacterium]
SLAQIPLRAPVLCKARFHQQAGVEAAGLTHPLIPDAVPNDLSWQQNLLISGSNASGKSTFIKAVAVNLILAQSLGLCFAQSFALRRGRVMSAMAVRDNLLAGESYFIVEIKSLKRILDAMDSGAVYCFIDEILRGTNTVERIAASSAVLESLSGRDSLCMAATHDIELTRLLADSYENRHFAETVDGSGLRFDYKIKPGPTRTRNAIRLLAQMGYPPQVIQAARRRAEAFERTGAWQ